MSTKRRDPTFLLTLAHPSASCGTLVALAHRQALDGDGAQLKVREGASGKLYLAHLCDPDGCKVCNQHRVPRAQPVMRPSGRTSD